LKEQVATLEAERNDLSRKLEKAASASPQRSEAFMAAERVEAITRLQREAQKAREQNFKLRIALREAGGDPKALVGDDAATPSPDVIGIEGVGTPGSGEHDARLHHELAAARAQSATTEKLLAERERELSHRDDELAAAHQRAAELMEKLTEVENLLTTVRERSSPDVLASAEVLAAKDRRIAELEDELARARQMTPPTDSSMELAAIRTGDLGGGESEDDAEMGELITIQQVQIQELTEKLTDQAEKDLALAELMEQIADLEGQLGEKDSLINELMDQVVQAQGGG
jgi:hypothetical protein